MKDRLFFVLYIVLVIFISLLSSLKILTIVSLLLVLMLLLSPLKKKLNILKRTFYACLIFNLLVSLPYFLIGFWLGQDRFNYILMMVLRSFSLTLTTFMSFRLINLFKALDFSKNLSFLLVVVSTHLLTYLNLMGEFKEAFRSRTIRKPNRIARLNFFERILSFFFEKSIHTSKELHQAMKSRGFYD